MHQTVTLTTNSQPDNQYVKFMNRKSFLQKPASLNTENDKKFKKMEKLKRPIKVMPTSA